jgi:Uma2 family endonuclease
MPVVDRPIAPPQASRAARPADLIWRLTVDQYHAMIREAILTDDDPIELLEGWLVVKMSKNPRHRVATRLLRLALERILPAGWYAEAQEPITTPDSEPEPDVAVIRGDTRDYLDRHPGPADLALVVEVADTTLERDRTTKKRLYARAGIAVYWILNLVDNQLEVYSDPSGPADEPDYARRQDYAPGDEVAFILDGVEAGRLRVEDLLP